MTYSHLSGRGRQRIRKDVCEPSTHQQAGLCKKAPDTEGIGISSNLKSSSEAHRPSWRLRGMAEAGLGMLAWSTTKLRGRRELALQRRHASKSDFFPDPSLAYIFFLSVGLSSRSGSVLLDNCFALDLRDERDRGHTPGTRISENRDEGQEPRHKLQLQRVKPWPPRRQRSLSLAQPGPGCGLKSEFAKQKGELRNPRPPGPRTLGWVTGPGTQGTSQGGPGSGTGFIS